MTDLRAIDALRTRNDARGDNVSRIEIIRAATEAVLEPFGLAVSRPGNRFRGQSIIDIAEQFSIAAHGVRPESGRHAIVLGMHGTNDFPAFIDSVAQRAMLAGWEAGARSFQRFVGTVSVNDFRPQARIRVGGFSRLAPVTESGEIMGGDFGVYASTIAVSRKGIVLRLTEEMALNNNIAPLIENAKAAGRAAAASVNAAVYSLLAANPTLSDGGRLFNSTATDVAGGHGNLAFTPAPLSATALSLAKASMRRQRAPKGTDPLNIRARYLIVSAEAEDAAWDLVGLPGGFGESGSEQERYLLESGRVELVSDPELQGDAWYLAADPQVAPVIEIAYLDGVSEPSIVTRKEFRSDALEMKIMFDFGIAPGDWRGGYKNEGG